MKNICRNKNKEGFDYEEKGIIHDAGWRNDSVHAGRMRAGSDEAATTDNTAADTKTETAGTTEAGGVLQKHPEIR